MNRRAAFSLVVALLLFALLTTVATAIPARGDSSLNLQPATDGDVYWISTGYEKSAWGGGEGWENEEDLIFEWEGPSWGYTEHGEARQTRVLLEHDGQRPLEHQVDAETLEILSTSVPLESGGVRETWGQERIPCLLEPTLRGIQGRPQELVLQDCEFLDEVWDSVQFRLQGDVEAQGETLVHYRGSPAQFPEPDVTSVVFDLWFLPGLAAPLELQARITFEAFDFGEFESEFNEADWGGGYGMDFSFSFNFDWSNEYRVRQRLMGLDTQQVEPTISEPLVGLLPMQEVRWAPYGPAQEQSASSFNAAWAWAYMLGETTSEAASLARTGGRATWAEITERWEPEMVNREWYFVVQRGNDAESVAVTQSFPRAKESLPSVLAEATWLPTYTVEDRGRASPLSVAWPEHGPSPHVLAARSQSFGMTDGRVGVRAYGGEFHVTIEHDRTDVTPQDALNDRAERSIQALVHDDRGRLEEWSTQDQVWEEGLLRSAASLDFWQDESQTLPHAKARELPEGGEWVGIVATAAAGGALTYAVFAIKGLGAAGLFSRLLPAQVERHPARQAILELVEDQPGIHFQGIVDALGTGHGAAEHHLRKMLDQDMLVENRGAGRVCYYPKNFAHFRDMEILTLARTPAVRSALLALDAGEKNGREICASIGITPSTWSFHAKKLEAVGAIASRTEGRSKVYALTKRGQSTVRVMPGA